VMLKVLTQYQEATGDARVIPLMERYVKYQLYHMPAAPLKNWAVYRWEDEVVSLVWLYNRTGNADALELARVLRRQGFDWKAHFDVFPYRAKSTNPKSKWRRTSSTTAWASRPPRCGSLFANDAAAATASAKPCACSNSITAFRAVSSRAMSTTP